MNVIDAQAQEILLSRRRSIRRVFEENDAGEKRLHEDVERDWPDRAVQQESAVVLQRLTEVERHELVEIDAALDRIAHGTYGSCETCGGSIGRQRLRAIPEARKCILCSEIRVSAL
jgi:DnaK suppressor protein